MVFLEFYWQLFIQPSFVSACNLNAIKLIDLIQSFYFMEPKCTEVIHSSALTVPVMYRKGGRQLELQSGCHTSAILYVKFNIWSCERQRNNVIWDPVVQYHFKIPYKAIFNYSLRPKELGTIPLALILYSRYDTCDGSTMPYLFVIYNQQEQSYSIL